MAGQHVGEDRRAGERPGDRAAAAVHDHRHARVGQLPPDLVQQRVTRVVRPDLDVALEQPGAVGQGVADVGRRARLGEEGRGVHDVGLVGGEVSGPGVQPAGHRRPVRVDQRRERTHAHRAQQVEPALLLPPVLDRPRRTGQRAGSVEVRPDLVQDVLRHEVDVQVDQTGQPELLPEAGDLRVAERAQDRPRFSARPMALRISFCASRSAITWRLSWLLRPRASASSSLARPSLK